MTSNTGDFAVNGNFNKSIIADKKKKSINFQMYKQIWDRNGKESNNLTPTCMHLLFQKYLVRQEN